jgi:HSP20 family protein
MSIRDLLPLSRGKRDMTVRPERTNPLANPLGSLQLDINQAFADFWRAFDLPALGGGEPGATAPKVDVRETDREVEVTAELPGMDEADIDVSVADGVLTIRGERKEERETKDKDYVRRERNFGRIERIVPLPAGLDPNAATAKFKNGVLTVTIAKTAEARDAVKRIAVRRA